MGKRTPKDNRKDVFTILGEVRLVGDKKKFVINSPGHYQQELNQFPEGKRLACTFEEWKASRTHQQLAYHWVLVGYLAKHTGYTKEELHDAVMRQKFGVRAIHIGQMKQFVRKSISTQARFPLAQMIELIEYDLELCRELKIKVPTKKELGYLEN